MRYPPMGARRRPPAWRRHCRDAPREPCATRTPSDLAPASGRVTALPRKTFPLPADSRSAASSVDAPATPRQRRAVSIELPGNETRDGLVAQLTCRMKLVHIRRTARVRAHQRSQRGQSARGCCYEAYVRERPSRYSRRGSILPVSGAGSPSGPKTTGRPHSRLRRSLVLRSLHRVLPPCRPALSGLQRRRQRLLPGADR